MNGNPNSEAKYASLTAVDPDDASITGVPSVIQPLHRAYRNSERASRCFKLPVGCTDSSFMYRSMPQSAHNGKRSRCVSALRLASASTIPDRPADPGSGGVAASVEGVHAANSSPWPVPSGDAASSSTYDDFRVTNNTLILPADRSVPEAAPPTLSTTRSWSWCRRRREATERVDQLFQLGHRSDPDLQQIRLLPGHEIARLHLGDLPNRLGDVGVFTAGEGHDADQRRDPQSDRFGVDFSPVTGDHLVAFKLGHAFLNGRRSESHSPCELGI